MFLRPTIIGGDKLQDDYEVLDENRKPVGRIMLHPQEPQGRPWFWGNNRVPNIPGHDRGFAESREQAMADFKMAWLCKAVIRAGVIAKNAAGPSSQVCTRCGDECRFRGR